MKAGALRPRLLHTLTALAVSCVCASLPASAQAAQTLTIHAAFGPDRLGAPTNLSALGEFHSAEATGVPSPLSEVVVYLPDGLIIDMNGTGICARAALQAGGPTACPVDSRIGFGGGTGSLQLGAEVVHETYTVDLFLGSRESGHLELLAFLQASSPVNLELVMAAKQVAAPSPYGLGFALEVPPITTIPDASNASLESIFLTIGDSNIAYYRHVHGRYKLEHIRGIVVPTTCPSGGFPFEALVSFEDGTSLTSAGSIPCPEGR